jgi:hypothetical protein
VVRDISGDALPLRAAPGSLWRLMAVSGGAPLMMAGEWDGDSLIPLSAWSSTRLVGLM